MLNRIKNFEYNHAWFKVVEIIIIVLLLAYLVVQVAFPHLIFGAQLKNEINSGAYDCVSEEYNIYMTSGINEGAKEILSGYIVKEMENMPLYENDYTIIVVDDTLESKGAYSRQFNDDYITQAVTNPAYKTITLNKKYIVDSLHHEIGHAVDAQYKFSKSDEFKRLYDLVEHDDYLTGDIAEYFAENYYLFLENDLDPVRDTLLIEYYEGILGQTYEPRDF